MHIGIIIAMEEELASISASIPLQKTEEIFSIYKSQSAKLELSIIISKIGKVAASSATTYLIEKYNPDLMLNIGTCGGLNQANLASIIVSSTTAYHDVNVTGFGYKLGQLPGQNHIFMAKDSYNFKQLYEYLKNDYAILNGIVVTGDQFVNNIKTITAIKHMYPNIVAIDMEAAAIAQVCTLYNKDFILIKKVSDLADDNATASFSAELKKINQQMPAMISKVFNYFQA